MLTELLTFVGALLCLCVLYDRWSRPKNYPPGPFMLPFFGSLAAMPFKKPFLELVKDWRAKHGPIISFTFGSSRAVIFHDYPLMKEALSRTEFTGRPGGLAPFKIVAGENRRGLAASEGAQWEAQRRFALRSLRDVGFGKKSMESMAHEDIRELLEKLSQFSTRPVSATETVDLFAMAVVNSLWGIISGERHEFDDEKFTEILNKLNVALTIFSSSAPSFSMPWLIKIAPDWTGWTRFARGIIDGKAFIQSRIDQHKKTFQEGNLRDYMDAYINEMNKTTDPHSYFYKEVGDENMLVGVLNLMIAGIESTSSTLNWAVHFLSTNMEIQEKLQKEIDTVVGNSRLPSLNDWPNMPYASAVILENYRKATLLPLGLPHRCTTNTEFHGYVIPKDTLVFGNYFDLHHNEKIWGDPMVFRPERFLTPDGTALAKNNPVIAPFGTGNRQCLGEALAKNNVFLFMTSIFQRFRITKHKDSKDVPKRVGIFRFAPEFKVVFEDRHK